MAVGVTVVIVSAALIFPWVRSFWPVGAGRGSGVAEFFEGRQPVGGVAIGGGSSFGNQDGVRIDQRGAGGSGLRMHPFIVTLGTLSISRDRAGLGTN